MWKYNGLLRLGGESGLPIICIYSSGLPVFSAPFTEWGRCCLIVLFLFLRTTSSTITAITASGIQKGLDAISQIRKLVSPWDTEFRFFEKPF